MKIYKAQQYAYFYNKRHDRTPLYFASKQEAEEYSELVSSYDYDESCTVEEIEVSDGADILKRATELYERHKDNEFYKKHRKKLLDWAQRLIVKYKPNNFQI